MVFQIDQLLADPGVTGIQRHCGMLFATAMMMHQLAQQAREDKASQAVSVLIEQARLVVAHVEQLVLTQVLHSWPDVNLSLVCVSGMALFKVI